MTLKTSQAQLFTLRTLNIGELLRISELLESRRRAQLVAFFYDFSVSDFAHFFPQMPVNEFVRFSAC